MVWWPRHSWKSNYTFLNSTRLVPRTAWSRGVKKLKSSELAVHSSLPPWLGFNLSPSPITHCLLPRCVSGSDFSNRVQSCVKDMQLSQSAQLILGVAVNRQEMTQQKRKWRKRLCKWNTQPLQLWPCPHFWPAADLPRNYSSFLGFFWSLPLLTKAVPQCTWHHNNPLWCHQEHWWQNLVLVSSKLVGDTDCEVLVGTKPCESNSGLGVKFCPWASSYCRAHSSYTLL